MPATHLALNLTELARMQMVSVIMAVRDERSLLAGVGKFATRKPSTAGNGHQRSGSARCTASR
jgi:hypothetical protein